MSGANAHGAADAHLPGAAESTLSAPPPSALGHDCDGTTASYATNQPAAATTTSAHRRSAAASVTMGGHPHEEPLLVGVEAAAEHGGGGDGDGPSLRSVAEGGSLVGEVCRGRSGASRRPHSRLHTAWRHFDRTYLQHWFGGPVSASERRMQPLLGSAPHSARSRSRAEAAPSRSVSHFSGQSMSHNGRRRRTRRAGGGGGGMGGGTGSGLSSSLGSGLSSSLGSGLGSGLVCGIGGIGGSVASSSCCDGGEHSDYGQSTGGVSAASGRVPAERTVNDPTGDAMPPGRDRDGRGVQDAADDDDEEEEEGEEEGGHYWGGGPLDSSSEEDADVEAEREAADAIRMMVRASSHDPFLLRTRRSSTEWAMHRGPSRSRGQLSYMRDAS